MLRKVWLATVLLFLALALSTSSVLAQDGEGTGGDKFVLGQNYTLRSGETLNGSLAVLGGNATLEQGSTVNGDLVVFGGELVIAGTVRGSVAAIGGSATLEESAVIQGDFASYGGSVVRAPGATIQGQVLEGAGRGPEAVIPRIQTPFEEGWPFRPRGESGFGRLINWELGVLGAGLLLALLGVLAVLVAPKAMGHIASAAADQPAFTFGVGLLTFVVALLAGMLLLIACCIGLLVWLALVIAFVVGWIAVGLWFGQRLLAALKLHSASSLVEVAVGVFVITFLGRLPLCIGFLFSAIVGCIGLGAVVLTRFGTQPVSGRTIAPSPGDTGGDLTPLNVLPAGEPSAPSVSAFPEVAEAPSDASVSLPDEPSAETTEPITAQPLASGLPGLPPEPPAPEDTVS